MPDLGDTPGYGWPGQQVSTVPSSVRQDMSSPVATAFKDGVLDSLGLTASERHNLFRKSDRARDMYEAATSEKIAMIQFWRRSTHQAAEANGLERIERQQWMHNLSLLREHMQYDFQNYQDDLA
uniref:Uncharacterized protein n=1 Tax=Melanopsichium pennsylvanicum 4 TaxID=1398559 RepID=A0A077R686_9BASI|nr:hypothetical protein BN887_00216 [Melanopsichium pennsylvanicum 4]